MDAHFNQKSRKPKVALLFVVGLAVIVIAVSIFFIINPERNVTATNERVSTVSITDTTVVPSVMTIKKGDTITWVNSGDALVTLLLTTPNPPKEIEGFGMEPLTKGESYSFTFDVAGTFTYNDPQNPENIKGTIIVE